MSSSQRGSLSRASSSGSLTGGRGGHPHPEPTSEDEDSDSKSPQCLANGVTKSSSTSTSLSYRERRREAHTQAEQKRRDAIKKGYDYLMDLVPGSAAAGGGNGSGSDGGNAANNQQKVSKAAVLQRAIEYIGQVQGQKHQQEEELSMLRKEVVALEIMKGNYESLVKAHQNQQRIRCGMSGINDDDEMSRKTYVPAEVKARTFQRFMDKLFDSFNEQVGMNNFSELSGGVFSWLEDQCKPQMLQDVMYDTLSEVQREYQQEEVVEGRGYDK